MQEMSFQRPKIQIVSGGDAAEPPKMSSLLPKVTKYIDPPLYIFIYIYIYIYIIYITMVIVYYVYIYHHHHIYSIYMYIYIYIYIYIRIVQIIHTLDSLDFVHFSDPTGVVIIK